MAYISITDFGAVADGRDNRAAIQSAVDAAKAQGKDVFVPAGTYLHNGVITLNGVDMIGAGSASVLKAVGSTQQSIRLTGDGAAIKNIALDSDATTRGTQNNNAKINVDGASNFTVDGVTILNAHSAGMMIYGASYGTITNNIVKSTNADSIHMTGGSHHITVTGNRVENSGDDGIAVVSYGTSNVAHDIIVSGNTILNNAWGRNLSVVGGENVQITNNYISGNGAGLAGVYLATEPAYDTAGVSNVQVTGNTILNTGSSTTGHGNIMLYDGTAQTISNVTISGNFIIGREIRTVGDNIQASITNNQVNTGAAAPAVPPLPVYGGTAPTSPPVTSPPVVPPPAAPDVDAAPQAMLTVYANGDQYNGAPQFQLLLDGTPFGTAQSVTTTHSSGAWQAFSFTLPVGADPSQVGVKFINDAGGPGGDRNIYVDRIEVLGSKIAAGSTGNLYRNNETATFDVSKVAFPVAPVTSPPVTSPPVVTLPPPPVVTVPPPPPVVTVPPATEAVVKVFASGDSWNGAPQFQLLLDGTPFGTVQNVTTAHSSGAWQSVSFALPVGTDPNQIAVKFLNDAYGGSAATDRNLYVDHIEVQGSSLKTSAGTLYRTNEQATFDVSKIAFPTASSATSSGSTVPTSPPVVTSPPPVTSTPAPSTANPVTIKVFASGDSYSGAPQFQLLLDGKAYGAVQTVTTAHSWSASPSWQSFSIDLPLGVKGTQIGVKFLNDAYGPGGDRNLYVDRIEVEGTVVNTAHHELYHQGDVSSFNVSHLASLFDAAQG